MKGGVRAVVSCAVFVSVLCAVYFVHMRFFRVNVVLYASLLDVLIAAAVAWLALWLAGVLQTFNALERALITVIWLLAGFAFAISVPTVIDRSLSFYILEKLQQRGGGIREDRMGDVFTREYMVEHRLVDIRLTEQLESGTITVRDGCVQLTPKGEKFASFSRFYRTHLLPRQRLIMGGYTDDLTDPFRNSTASVNYQCQ